MKLVKIRDGRKPTAQTSFATRRVFVPPTMKVVKDCLQEHLDTGKSMCSIVREKKITYCYLIYYLKTMEEYGMVKSKFQGRERSYTQKRQM